VKEELLKRYVSFFLLKVNVFYKIGKV